MTEPYKEAISWFHSPYEKGLVDKEAFTHDFNVYVAKIQDPNKIVGMFLGWSGNATAAANKDDYVAMAPLINTNGERIWRTVDAKIISKGSFAITSKAEHPEVLMRWIDQSYDPESSPEICQAPPATFWRRPRSAVTTRCSAGRRHSPIRQFMITAREMTEPSQ